MPAIILITLLRGCAYFDTSSLLSFPPPTRIFYYHPTHLSHLSQTLRGLYDQGRVCRLRPAYPVAGGRQPQRHPSRFGSAISTPHHYKIDESTL